MKIRNKFSKPYRPAAVKYGAGAVPVGVPTNRQIYDRFCATGNLCVQTKVGSYGNTYNLAFNESLSPQEAYTRAYVENARARENNASKETVDVEAAATEKSAAE